MTEVACCSVAKGRRIGSVAILPDLRKDSRQRRAAGGEAASHVLKHSLASHLIAGNVNLALVQQCLGHRSINSTMAYVHAQDEQAAEAAQRALMALY